MMKDMGASLGTISEVPSVSIPDLLTRRYLTGQFQHYTYKIGYDYLTTYWDQNVWELEKNEFPSSNVGKYVMARFRHNASAARVLHASVHLPHKSNRAPAYRALRAALAECAQGVQAVVVSGDFNAHPDAILNIL
eukprot:EG_transcript_33707